MLFLEGEHTYSNMVQGSALFRLSGFLELKWTILEIDANLMRKFLVLATTLRAFQAFGSSARQTPDGSH